MTLATRATLEGHPPQLYVQFVQQVTITFSYDRFFTERRLSSQGPKIPSSPSTRTVTVGNLHDDVLLEIFDFYLQSFRDQPSSERIWNNKNGWFKLAHVCHNWRSVVLASPCRLRMRLYFAHDTPTRAAVLQAYPHLPIIVDYSNVGWNANALRGLVSALRYPDRVCRIAIMGSHKPDQFAIISKALDSSFPALESLGLHILYYFKPTILLSSPFRTSIQSIRHLQLNGASTTFPILPQILSVTTSLVSLTLNVISIPCLTNGASIFFHLQCLPHMRNLHVSESPRHRIPYMGSLPPTTTTLLAELTYFRLSGGCSEIEWFVAGLVAPSLRGIHISIQDACGILEPNLSELIRLAEIIFFAARLTISHQTFQTSLFAHPLSIDDPPSKTVTIETPSLPRPDSASSPMLATVEDIFLSLSDHIEFDKSLPWKRLREFFKEFRKVKSLRLYHGLETIVAHMLRLPTANSLPAGEEVDPDATTPSTPINHSGSQSTSDILPSLEEIVVYARTPSMSIDEKEIASVLDSFGPFKTARQRVGRPVKVFWNTNGKVPRYFMTGVEVFME